MKNVKNIFNMTIQEITNRPIAVNCTTESDADKFLKMCEERGLIWGSGALPTSKNNWEHYEHKTCYSTIGVYIFYCEVDVYAPDNYTIINFNEITD